MRRFAQLVQNLDQTNGTKGKTEALARYFRTAPPADAMWTIALFSGRRPKRSIPTSLLRLWAREETGLPEWLFAECYQEVGDLAETVALLLPPATGRSERTLTEWIRWVRELGQLPEDGRRTAWREACLSLEGRERFVLLKLLTGGFRLGVAQGLILRALAQVCGRPVDVLAHRLMGPWQPEAAAWAMLTGPEGGDEELSRPYPFCLAAPLDGPPEDLGDCANWLAEWKWDGIRAQLIRRGKECFLWSRGEELVSESFPEIIAAAQSLPPGTVLDGELLPWPSGQDHPLPFHVLQTRLGRKKPPARLIAAHPVIFLAYDLLEWDGQDGRNHSLQERRRQLESLFTPPARFPSLRLSPLLEATDWSTLTRERETSRSRQTEGLMLKALDSPYGTGRKRGLWWKWKIDPLSIDAVLIYAQRGHGRRSGLYTDYTFAVWKEDQLIPFAKAYSGLSEAEIREVDRFIKSHTREKFGPVRTVEPELVFEIGFEGLQPSQRHKSGLAVRFPRILRWRKDKRPADANQLADLERLLRHP